MRLLTVAAATLLAAAGCAAATDAPAGAPASVATTPAPAAAATATGSATAATTGPCGWRSTTGYRHVVWIWMENRTYASVMGGSSAPHVRSYAAKCGLASRYYAVTHPSLPNYLAATSGRTGGVTTDCAPSSCPQSRGSVFGQLQTAGKTWRGYAESMPGGCVLSSSGRYATKHNPAVYYPPIRTRCRSWDVPMGGSTGAFATALAHRTLPAFSFVTPDMCHDGHDCSLPTADSWLGTWLGRITASSAYRAGDTAVFVTWDEGVGTDQHVVTLVVAPSVRRGTVSATHFTHYSLLRTTEELLGLHPLNAAATATSMRKAFHL